MTAPFSCTQWNTSSSSFRKSPCGTNLSRRPRPVLVHSHLFGALFATAHGCAFLQSRIDMKELCAIISDPSETLMNRRAVLWAVAHVVNQEEGEAFIQVMIAMNHEA